ncbi:SDR family oxidoreductase [Microbacterium sp. cx-55]|uniref:SDR family NAD(P)-dependent oxidoreductase n=1 Tax=unclassified Microbacterium TaxID=2609290 RepID=UPI001CC0DA31|nr:MULTISPECIES: SDR family oxidoreductase [unclassified Microbacterium]MBZ4486040.1 SDR family oxidoreductase [Microbacterium sp. cx-55]MCC4907032.1 SDR family oxidoreductase [Microbacterium sp. cx-59]UGB34088.1 SDR family oxidoreductase [Microbacterium sp. cx-55]
MTTSLALDLTGRTALVTGSTQGIGNAIARRLAESGADVVVNGRGESRVAAAVDQIDADLGLRVRGIAADVTTEQGAAQLMNEAGRVDVLVNNLGIFEAIPALEIDDDTWRRAFEVNVLSAARLTRLALPAMTAQSWGRVITIASDSAIVTPKEMIHYGVTKTALLALTRGYAKEAAGTGVTVNTVIAGPTHTPGVEDFVYSLVDPDLPWDDAQREFMRTQRPQSLIGRLLEPIEIANMVAYLASPLSSGTTGGALRADGGYVDAILP